MSSISELRARQFVRSILGESADEVTVYCVARKVLKALPPYRRCLSCGIQPRYLMVSWADWTDFSRIAGRHGVIMEEIIPSPFGLLYVTYGLLGDGANIDAFLNEINADHS